MYKSSINIKHGCLTHLFWGRDIDSGEYIHINDVKQNGLGCNCQCPVCKGVYIACMGEKNRPYFKHQSKYKCMYTDEITTYLRTKQLLESANSIFLPSLPVRFGARTFKAELSSASIEDVYYHCDEEQYPPLMIVTVDKRLTRILLAFEGYYSYEDLEIFRSEAAENKWDCLVINMPKVDADDCIGTSQLQAVVLGASARKSWLHSELVPYWQKRLQECSKQPDKVIAGVSEAFACPIHKQLYRDQYYASRGDCEKCQFNLGTGHDCHCAAEAGITCISDFEVSEELRKHRVTQLRNANEQSLAEQKRAAELAKQAKLQEAEQRKMGFYLNKTCPKCGRPLKKMPGKKGTNWLCLGRQCGFHAFENYETGELITHGLD